MFKWLKQLFCKHEKTCYMKSELVKVNDGTYVTQHIHMCKKCGKMIYGGHTKSWNYK